MIKPKQLQKGDKVAIVSLSSGILGESFIKFELDLGVKRLKEMGLEPVFMENSLKGMDFIKNNPDKRADDLKQAFADDSINAIICAIGGNDTYLTLPHLLEDESFKNNVLNKPKIFLGFSDSTTNHLMLNKLGLVTFYGQSFLVDLAEFEPNMLKYTQDAFLTLFGTNLPHEIKPSNVWFEDRTDYSENAVGTLRISHDNSKGYELLQGSGTYQGKIFGGCLEVLGEFLNMPTENETLKQICEKYNMFPTIDSLKNNFLLIETSEEKMSPENFKLSIQNMKNKGVFDAISGLLVGKPVNETYYEEYKQILIDELSGYNFPVLYNLNIGHAYPHTILPLGVLCEINCTNKTLKIIENPFN